MIGAPGITSNPHIDDMHTITPEFAIKEAFAASIVFVVERKLMEKPRQISIESYELKHILF